MRLFASPDLKQWRRLGDVPMPGSGECPDFFALPVDGNADNTKWVFWAANNHYRLGRFDGKTFTPESEPLQSHWGKNRYAAQTFADIPAGDGRRIQIAWMAGGKYPNMPFNQQLSFPVTLALRTFPEGVRLCTWPVKEIDNLHDKHHHWAGTLKPGQNPLADVQGELFDVRLEIEPASAAEVGLNIRGVPIQYNVKEQTLSCMGSIGAGETDRWPADVGSARRPDLDRDFRGRRASQHGLLLSSARRQQEPCGLRERRRRPTCDRSMCGS